MTHLTLSRRRVFGAASSLVSLGGCSVLFPSPAPQLYRLVPHLNSTPFNTPASGQLVVSAPVAPESLDTARIALARGRTTLDYFASAVWTDRVPLLLQTLMINTFKDIGQVIAVGRDSSGISADYRLDTDIRDFQARYPGPGESQPVIVVSVDAQLIRMTDHRAVGHTQVAKEVPAAQNNLDSIVDAFDSAVGEVIDQIVLWTLQSMVHTR
jgi:cholesterol transport system auxiliary component